MMHGTMSKGACLVSSIGAINWGLVRFMNMDLISRAHMLIGVPNLDTILYGVVALCGLYTLVGMFYCPSCH